MDYGLTEDQQMIREAADVFADEQIKPQGEAIEYDTSRLAYLVRAAGKLGFLGMCLPEDIGGIGADTVSFALAVEAFSKADASFGSYLIIHNALIGEALMHADQREVVVPWLEDLTTGDVQGAFAGISHTGDKITVSQDGTDCRVQGRHKMVTGAGVSQFLLVQARSATSDTPACALLLMPKETSGLEIGEIQKTLGLRGAACAPVVFDNLLLPQTQMISATDQAAEIVQEMETFAGIGVAAQALGLAEASCEAAKEYAGMRQQFGEPIRRFQAIAFMLAEMQTAIEAARHMTYNAAWLRDQGKDSCIASAQARLYAVGMVKQVTNTALQIHGGYGYIREYPVERYFRDARMLGIIDGPTDVQKRIIAGDFIED